MTTTHQIASGQLIDLNTQVVGVARSTRQAVLVDQEPGRAPYRIDGLTIGAPLVAGDAPHDGEVHPDGDELLYLVSGAMSLRLEYPDGDVEVELHAGRSRRGTSRCLAQTHAARTRPTPPHHPRPRRPRSTPPGRVAGVGGSDNDDQGR